MSPSGDNIKVDWNLGFVLLNSFMFNLAISRGVEIPNAMGVKWKSLVIERKYLLFYTELGYLSLGGGNLYFSAIYFL